MNEPVPADVPPLGRLTETLSGQADVASLTRILTVTLADVLPTGMVQVDYERSMSDRMRGRPGQPVGLTVNAGEKILTLKRGVRGQTEAAVAHAVRGVIITRAPVSIADWITTLAQELTNLGEHDDAARVALTRLLLG
jgi:hypothetical protein